MGEGKGEDSSLPRTVWVRLAGVGGRVGWGGLFVCLVVCLGERWLGMGLETG